MASVDTGIERGLTLFTNLLVKFTAKASAAISNNRFLKATSTAAQLKVATASVLNSPSVVGVSGDADVASGAEIQVTCAGIAQVQTAAVCAVGDPIITDASGYAIPLATSGTAGTVIKSGATGAAFTNQPANDGLELVSSSTSDTTQTVTIWGTTHGGEVVVSETITCNGTSEVSTTKTDWGSILAVEKSAVTVGTLTIREASANATVITLAPSVLSAGKIATTTPYAYMTAPTVEASGASTAIVGLIGTTTAGAAALFGDTLSGTAAQTTGTACYTVTYVLTGAVAADRTVTVKSGAAADATTLNVVGVALTPAATSGDIIDVKLK